MKTFTLLTSIVILLLTTQMFSQANNGFELKQDLLLQERIIPQSIQYKIDEHLSESDIFKKNECRIQINKTILQNGFLLMEHTIQDWNGSNWVNDWRYTYTYDGNNNMIEEVSQEWFGSNWVNYWKYTFTYDGNNNMIEELQQECDGSNWIDNWINSYTYDGNNNMIEQLRQDWDGANWVDDWRNTY
ncbi:MAG: DUF3836 domain-containing protein, partial [Ignavibacteriaceae bacterium]|nr:DUF3836 domain-containing protein [Ignavibacteriaceae bacterium]